MTDTQPSTLPPNEPPTGSWAPPEPDDRALAPVAASRSVRAVAMSVVIVVLIGVFAVSVASIIPLGWIIEKENARLGVNQPVEFARVPATATAVDDRIRIGDLGEVPQYPPSGDIRFVTVSEPEQSLLSWFVGRNNPAIQFLTREDKFGFQTEEQREVIAMESMRTSEQVAQFVALDRLGFDVEVVPGDVLIQQMVCIEPTPDGTECARTSPSDEVLDPGDRIVAVEGRTIDTVEDLTAVLADRAPGDLVEMTIERPSADRPLEVEVELSSAPDDPERAIVGFYPFDTASVNLPFELDIDTGSIGGPSAGLAFALTLIDELSEGELTGGQRVAVTGSIGLDGSVGPIGGLRQKVSAVEQNGVDVFIVPATQPDGDLDAARAVAADEVEIIPVGSLDEALAALESIGGEPLPERTG